MRSFAIVSFGFLPILCLGLAAGDPHVASPSPHRSIKDMRGRDVTAAVPARHALIFAPVSWIYLTIDGDPGHIAAVSRPQSGENELSRGLLRRVFPSVRDLARAPTLGGDSVIPGDPEAILLTRSDAILSWSWFAAPLLRIGAPLVQLDSRASGDVSQSVEHLWRLIGAIADRQERVNFLIRRHVAELDAFSKERAPAPVRRKVAYLFQIDPLIMAFGGTGINADLDRVDADNIGASLHSPHMTIEELIAREPEVVIISGYPKDDAVRRVLDNPALRCTPAVRSKRVYREPHGGMRMEGLVEEPIMLQWMSEVIYPEWIERRFRMKLRQAYADVYGFGLTDDAIDEALVLQENAGSADYSRFLASNDAERR
ncbi:hypothetical protein Ms3S1_p10530 (plasmid) [Methylosinus sp. 3S-1]